MPELLIAQAVEAEGTDLNWWDGWVETWYNLPIWAQAVLLVVAVALIVGFAASIVLWLLGMSGLRSARDAAPARKGPGRRIVSSWLALPGWAKGIQVTVLILIAVGAVLRVSPQRAELRASPVAVAFGGVVVGDSRVIEVRLSNLGTTGSPADSVGAPGCRSQSPPAPPRQITKPRNVTRV